MSRRGEHLGTFKCAYDAAVAVAERNKQIAAQVECDDTDAASSMGGVKVEVTASSNGYRVTVTLADGSQVCCSRSKLDGMRTLNARLPGLRAAVNAQVKVLQDAAEQCRSEEESSAEGSDWESSSAASEEESAPEPSDVEPSDVEADGGASEVSDHVLDTVFCNAQ